MPLDTPAIWLPPAPAIVRPAEHALLKPGAFAPVTREERRAIIADLVRAKRLTAVEARRAMFFVPIVGWAVAAAGGNDAFTTLLLHCEGSDASTSFTDSSAGAHTMTAGGNGQIDTAQFKFGAASYLGDGSGDSIRPDSHVDFAFGTGDFTIDFWVRFNSVAAALSVCYCSENQNHMVYLSSTGPKMIFHAAGSTRITGTTNFSTGTWYHIAVSRASGSTRLFVNGTQEGSTYTDSNNYGTSAQRPFIGINLDGNWSLNGWLDEVRVSKGIARWTANFTPPAVPYS